MCANELTKSGYTITRSAASKGVFDIVGFNKNHFIMVQVKRAKVFKYSFKKEREEISKYEVPPNSKKELWLWIDKLKKWEKYKC